MNAEYIKGCKDRANKVQPGITPDPEYLRGYGEMHDLLAPIEQAIILATFKYRAVAESRIRELEEQFRARDTAGAPAESASQGE